jgi:hypothetical protein
MSESCVATVLHRLARTGSDAISDEDLQLLLAAAVRQYSVRAAERPLNTFPMPSDVTATDVMLTATGMLRAVDVQLFEFGIWQTFSGARSGWSHEAKA